MKPCVHCDCRRRGEEISCCLCGEVVAQVVSVASRLSALRGQEGRPRPGSEAAGKVHGAPLSGLDAATVEACAREALSVAWDSDDVAEYALTVAARIRALATPPGQAKP